MVEDDLLYSFLMFKFTKEFGIPDKYASAIAPQVQSLEALKTADFDNINGFIDGKPIFTKRTNNHLKMIKIAVASINYNLPIVDNFIQSIGKFFIDRQVENISKLTLGDINVNPFMITLLKFRDYTEAIELLVIARVVRSIVTSLGMTFEYLIQTTGAKKLKSGFDFETEINGIVHRIQVKSGTNTMNKDMLLDWIKKIQEFEKEGGRGVIGMPYGRYDNDTVTMGLFKTYYSEGIADNIWIGKELWENLTGEKDFHIRVLDNLKKVSHATISRSSITDLIKDKTTQIVREFEDIYGTGNAAMDNYLSAQF